MNRAARFLRDTRANVTIMTALALPVMMMLVGGAVDYAHKLDARAKLQSAVDAALLATMSHKQKDPTVSSSRLSVLFAREFERRYSERLSKKGLIVDKVKFKVEKGGAATAEVTGRVKTTFMRLAAINELPLKVISEAKASRARTEVALVLDVTGSMRGSKLAELKRATRKFIDTIANNVASRDPKDFRVAIVPFSQYVNVGKQYRRASWIQVPPDGYRTMQKKSRSCTYTRCVKYTYGGMRCSYSGPMRRVCRKSCRYVGSMDGGYRRVCTTKCTNQRTRVCRYDPSRRRCVSYRKFTRYPCFTSTSRRRRYIKWEGCVGSRNYPLNISDGNYGVRVPGVMDYTRDTRYDDMHYRGYTWEYNYCPRTPITPLKSVKTQKTALQREIDKLSANGWTYIPAGLVWGWRVLSPQAPFTEGADDNEVQKYNVQKIIVLMTDGENTRAPDRRSSRAYKDHGSGSASYANDLTRRLCKNITAINPATGRRNAEIVTITFDVRSSTVKKLLRDCSTLGSYDVGTGQLEKIFEDIATQLVELHLSR